VLEVGVAETDTQLRQDAAAWLSATTTVQIVVIIFIRQWRRGLRPYRRRMLVRMAMPAIHTHIRPYRSKSIRVQIYLPTVYKASNSARRDVITIRRH
jgi:hypothetical protein